MYQFGVSGMSCGHCVSRISDAVREIDRAATVTANPGNGEVRVVSHLDLAVIARAIERAGYPVREQGETG